MNNGVATERDVEAIEARGFPADLPASTYALLERTARAKPSAPALSFFLTAKEHAAPERWTYAELFAEVNRAANAFHAAGAKPDTVIAYILPNLPETYFTIFGAEAAGVVMALNPLLEAQTLGHLLHAAGASMVVTLGPFPRTDLFAKVARALHHAPQVTDLFVVELAARVRGARRLFAKLAAQLSAFRLHRAGEGRRALPPTVRVHDFHRALASSRSDALASGRVPAAGERASLFCTGGTTGLPKIAARTHGNEVANTWSATQCLGDGVGPGKNLLCGLPLFHVNGLMVTGLVPFFTGAHVVLATPQGYRGEGVVPRFWEIVERHSIHFISGVPTLYASLLQVPSEGHKIDSLDYAICGAAPLPLRVLREFEERTGGRILEGYGLTEATCISSVNPPRGERRPGSVGLRLPGQPMKIVLLDGDGRYLRDAAGGEVGAVVVGGPNVFSGYLSAAQNEKIFPDLGDGERWLDTGDLGRKDADGYFWLTGRKKELIIRGGHNIDPSTIEDPLHRHPAVLLAAAVGRPDAHLGELPVAYVELRPGARVTEEELLAFVTQEIAERAAIPKAVTIVDKMPLTAVGKIYKPELKRREAEAVIGAALRAGGVQMVRLALVDDLVRGPSIELTVAPRAAAAARTILEGYAFPFTITMDPLDRP